MTTHEEFEKFLLDISCGYGDLIILVDPQEANEARQRYLNGRKKALATYEDQVARIAVLKAAIAVERTTAENRLELLRTKDSHIGDLEWAIKCACDFLDALQNDMGIGEQTAFMLREAVGREK
jgi:hypothetical protein